MFGLYPPTLIFDITIEIDKQAYTTTDGRTVVDHLDTLTISPEKRVVSSEVVAVSLDFYHFILFSQFFAFSIV